MGRQCKKRRGSLVRDKAAIGAQVVDLALEGTTGVDSVNMGGCIRGILQRIKAKG